MTARVLILDGNTTELRVGRRLAGLPGVAESYGAALCGWRPDLDVTVERPYSPGFDPGLAALSGADGLVITGSGVVWSAADERARPFWRALEGAFAAGVPVLGSCWGLQLAAVVLGGSVGSGPNGVEAGFARDVTLSVEGMLHPLHAGRAPVFDVLCMHRDDVIEVPDGAVVTASNAHTRVQAMVYERGDVRVWGLQYHPEMGLADVAHYMERSAPAFGLALEDADAPAGDLRCIAAGAPGADALCDRHGIGPGITDPATHGRELGNWVETALGLPVSAPRRAPAAPVEG